MQYTLTFMALLAVGCSKKDDVAATSEGLETIAPETTAEQIVDKLEEKPDYTVPTIGTTEAVVDAEGNKDTVGITETFEDDSYMAVMPDGDTMIASMSSNCPNSRSEFQVNLYGTTIADSNKECLVRHFNYDYSL